MPTNAPYVDPFANRRRGPPVGQSNLPSQGGVGPNAVLPKVDNSSPRNPYGDPRIASLYSNTAKADAIIARVFDKPGMAQDYEKFKAMYNHGMDRNGWNAGDMAKKMGISVDQLNSILDAQALKKQYESWLSTPGAQATMKRGQQTGDWNDFRKGLEQHLATDPNMWGYHGAGPNGLNVASTYGTIGNALDKLDKFFTDFGDPNDPDAPINTGGAPATPAAPTTPTAPTDTSASDEVNKQLQGLIGQNTGSLDNDPRAQSLARIGGGAALRAANAAGIRGGLTGAGVEAGAQRALAPYEMERRQLALQGLSALSNRDLGLRQSALATLQAQNEAAGNNMGQAAGIGGAIGSGIGAIGDIIAGIYKVPTNGAISKALGGVGTTIGGGVSGGVSPYSGTPGYTGYTRGGTGSGGGVT